MAAAGTLVLGLCLASVWPSALGCPEPCACSDKYGRHFAECSFRDLAQVPAGFPPNVTTLSLSANRIVLVPSRSFDGMAGVTSLWLAHNRIAEIQPGALAPLIHLRNLDVGHNRMATFPWEDLRNLTALHLLKMNHNRLAVLPADAFDSLGELHSLRINGNRLATVAEGTFDGLASLSHLQLDDNPLACTCGLDWLRDWLAGTPVSIPDRRAITCASPEKFKGESIEDLPESECSGPNVTVRSEPDVRDAPLPEGARLLLTCESGGNPAPVLVWSVSTRSQKRELAVGPAEDESPQDWPVTVFRNGTLLLSSLGRDDSGRYSCSATNEVGRAEDSLEVEVEVVAVPQNPAAPTETSSSSDRRTTDRLSVLDVVRLPDLRQKDGTDDERTRRPTSEEAERSPPVASQCGVTANTRYVSGNAQNGSLDDVKQYTFDFGVIALGVSQTEATVRLNSLLVPREKSAGEDEEPSSESEERRNLAGMRSDGLYLCVTADRRHAAVQWSRIEEGVNTYVFSGLRPGTNYSLCLTYGGEDCEVQVRFTTRRKVPNLLIIVSVSICLLTVSTVPLLGATCFHLVYKYRGKTYKLILKAKDQYRSDRHLATNLGVRRPRAESHGNVRGSRLDEEEDEGEAGEKEADTEESVATESFSLSQCRASDDGEAGSEYSDRLPLGAEAVTVSCNLE